MEESFEHVPPGSVDFLIVFLVFQKLVNSGQEFSAEPVGQKSVVSDISEMFVGDVGDESCDKL